MVFAGIRVNGDEQIRMGFVSDMRSFFKGNEGVIVTRIDDVGAGQALANNFSQAQGYVQAQILFHQASRANGSGVVSAVAGIDYDSSDFQSQCASKGRLAVACGLGRGDG